MNSTSMRSSALLSWLEQQLKATGIELLPMTGDASFRYYYRIKNFTGLIAVDAAPHLANDNHGFVVVAQLLKNIDLNVPIVYAHDLERGFLLISDLGHTVYLDALCEANADDLYGNALDSLARLQTVQALEAFSCEAFDASRMRTELDNFRIWVMEKFLNIQLDPIWSQKLTLCFEKMLTLAVEQPQVFIHRDYHSRNLLVCENNPGILDFQDAMIGPITYDAVSLLRDAYIAWPVEKVARWTNSFYDRIYDRKDMHGFSHDHFMYAFDAMGMQRHLKAAFIFARKFLRDDVDRYLVDIPRTLKYVEAISRQYAEFNDLHILLQERVLPALAEKGYA